MPQGHNVAREGLIAGILGATAGALWFLLVDAIAGRPFFTPTLLGTALFSVVGGTAQESALTYLIVYTIIHYAAFVGSGLVVSYVVHKAETEPSVLVVFMLLFIIFELGFYGVILMLAETALRSLAWYQIAAGNVLASALMGVYMWRTHPALGQDFAHAMGGEE
jgi:hypothetical protein